MKHISSLEIKFYNHADNCSQKVKKEEDWQKSNMTKNQWCVGWRVAAAGPNPYFPENIVNELIPRWSNKQTKKLNGKPFKKQNMKC